MLDIKVENHGEVKEDAGVLSLFLSRLLIHTHSLTPSLARSHSNLITNTNNSSDFFGSIYKICRKLMKNIIRFKIWIERKEVKAFA